MTELPGGSWTAYFDSCMREDCNGVVYQALSVCHAISIHACTRIATLLLGGSVIEQTILIHARVRIATVILYNFFLDGGYFDSCMREGCNGLKS